MRWIAPQKCIDFFDWLKAPSTHCFDFLQFLTELLAQQFSAVHGEAQIVDSSDLLVFFAFLLIYHHCQSQF